MYDNKWTRAQPALARPRSLDQSRKLVTAGHDRADIAARLRIRRYLVDRLRGATEPEGGMPMKLRSAKK